MIEPESIIRKIANTLYINIQNINSDGLLNGKSGIALCFYHFTRYTKNAVYEEFADEYLTSIYDKMNKNSSKDFAGGLAGFGWFINHLIVNGFVQTDGEDNILEETDISIREMKVSDFITEADNEIPLFSKGLYFLARNNIPAITETLFECTELLEKKDLPSLPLCYLNSILYFVIGAYIISIETTICEKLILTLHKRITSLLKKKLYDGSDLITLKKNINQLSACGDLLDWRSWLAQVDTSREMLLRSGWNQLVYSYNTLEDVPIEEINAFVDITIRDIKKRDFTLYSGLAGLGLGLVKLASLK